MLGANLIKAGSLTVPNPAAAQTVIIGFKPSYVKAININDLAEFEHYAGMTAGHAIKEVNDATTQKSVITSNGITLTADGFTLGTAICDTAADVVYYIAFR